MRFRKVVRDALAERITRLGLAGFPTVPMTTDSHCATGYDWLEIEIAAASADRQRLKNLRRRIRRDRSLTETERGELLAHARYVPGCKPSPVEPYGPTYPRQASSPVP